MHMYVLELHNENMYHNKAQIGTYKQPGIKSINVYGQENWWWINSID